MTAPNAYTFCQQMEVRLESLLDGVVVEAFGIVNQNPARAYKGWIGVYAERMELAPTRLGRVSGGLHMDGSHNFILLVQRASAISGKDCANKLETTLNAAIDDIFSITDWTPFGVSADSRPTGLTKEYAYDTADKGQVHLQSAFVTINMTVEA